jgi:hypothetical protein
MPAAMRHGQGSLSESVEKDLATLASWGMVYRRDPLELVAPMRAALGLAKPASGHVPLIENPAGPVRVAAPTGRREFITADDIRSAHRDGRREFKLPANAVVTEEARDVAAALHVAFV